MYLMFFICSIVCLSISSSEVSENLKLSDGYFLKLFFTISPPLLLVFIEFRAFDILIVASFSPQIPQRNRLRSIVNLSTEK